MLANYPEAQLVRLNTTRIQYTLPYNERLHYEHSSRPRVDANRNSLSRMISHNFHPTDDTHLHQDTNNRVTVVEVVVLEVLVVATVLERGAAARVAAAAAQYYLRLAEKS